MNHRSIVAQPRQVKTIYFAKYNNSKRKKEQLCEKVASLEVYLLLNPSPE